MSDLASFVAAALRDKVVAELKHENETQASTVTALKSSIHDLSSVFVTGPGGSPIYCKWKLNIDSTERAWDGLFFNTRSIGFPEASRSISAQELRTAEIRIAGVTHLLCDFKANDYQDGGLVLRPVDNSKMRVLTSTFDVELSFQLNEGGNSVVQLVEKLQASHPKIKLWLRRIYIVPEFLAECLASRLSELIDDEWTEWEQHGQAASQQTCCVNWRHIKY